MKTTIIGATLSALLVLGSGMTMAQGQAETGNVFVYSYQELSLDPSGSASELDSLIKLYTDNVIKKNELILSHRTIRHWWGHNNRDFIDVYEVKDFADIPKVFDRNNELFEKAWPTKEARDKYSAARRKYFTGKHSDEIYSEVKSGRK